MKKPSPKSVVRKSLYTGGVLAALLVGTAMGAGPQESRWRTQSQRRR